MNKTNKMQTERLDKNELHKQLIICFGSIPHAGHALRYAEKSAYYWINNQTKKPSRHKLAKGFDEHDKDLAKLKVMLGLKT